MNSITIAFKIIGIIILISIVIAIVVSILRVTGLLILGIFIFGLGIAAIFFGIKMSSVGGAILLIIGIIVCVAGFCLFLFGLIIFEDILGLNWFGLNPNVSVSVSYDSDFKTCPQCKETINCYAKKYKYCGSKVL